MTAFTGTVDLTETGGGAGGTVTPSPSSAFTLGVLSGQSVTLSKSGTLVTITATDHAGTGKTGASGTFTVNPGVLDHFAISPITSPQVAGTAITGITLTAQDVNNNTVTSFTTTVAYSGTAGITGTSAAFTAGQLTGVSVTPITAGSGKTFVVTGSTKTGTSTFDVNPGALAKFVSDPRAATQVAGTAFAITTITAQDANNNTVTASPGPWI